MTGGSIVYGFYASSLQSPVAMDPKLSDPFISGRFATSRTVDEPKSPGVNQRPPLTNEGLSFTEMPVSRSSKLPLSASCDVGGAYNPMISTVAPPPPHSEDSSRWVMYPPVPAYGSEHLRTGRFHLMRNTSPDGNAVTYMEQALHHVIFWLESTIFHNSPVHCTHEVFFWPQRYISFVCPFHSCYLVRSPRIGSNQLCIVFKCRYFYFYFALIIVMASIENSEAK